MTKRILVVEDQEDLRGVLRTLLTGSGYEMLEAADGQAGVAAAKAECPDLILMDIQMPVLDGYDATRQIKDDPALKATPVIAVSSFAMKGDEEKARASGWPVVRACLSLAERRSLSSDVCAPIGTNLTFHVDPLASQSMLRRYKQDQTQHLSIHETRLPSSEQRRNLNWPKRSSGLLVDIVGDSYARGLGMLATRSKLCRFVNRLRPRSSASTDLSQWMTIVKDQEEFSDPCNCCTAYAVAATFEGTYNKKHNPTRKEFNAFRMFKEAGPAEQCNTSHWWPENALKYCRSTGITELALGDDPNAPRFKIADFQSLIGNNLSQTQKKI